MSLNATFIILEDGTRAPLAGQQIYAGSPLTLDPTTGYLKLATATSKVYGLSKADCNQYDNFAFGEFAAFGSGQLTVLTRGICVLSASIYNEVEVYDNAPSSSPVTVNLYDATQNYLAMQPLYVDVNGLVSNVNTAGKGSLIGKVLTPLAAGAAGGLEMEVDPGATSYASTDMA